MKKIIRIMTVLSLLLVAQWNLQAQRPFSGQPHRGPGLEQFAEELGLTDAQKADLKALHETNRSEMKALMDQEFSAPEDRREAMKGLMDKNKKATEAILTEAQVKKLAGLKQEERAKRQAERKINAENHKSMREDMKTYRETEILPVLKAQRAKLETQLSAEDKATIAALRAKREAHLQAREAQAPNPEMRGKRPELTEAQKAEMQADREKIKTLADKYDSQITALMEDIKDDRETWREHNQEIAKKYAPEQVKDRAMRERPDFGKEKRMAGEKRSEIPGKGKGKGMGEHPRRMPMHEGMGKAGFLLLNPNAETTPAATTKADFAELRVFPNPSSSRNTVNYQLKEAGNYRVELRDKDGLVLQVLSNEYRTAGSYEEQIDLSKYAAGTYYVSIVGAEGVISKKVVLAK